MLLKIRQLPNRLFRAAHSFPDGQRLHDDGYQRLKFLLIRLVGLLPASALHVPILHYSRYGKNFQMVREAADRHQLRFDRLPADHQYRRLPLQHLFTVVPDHRVFDCELPSGLDLHGVLCVFGQDAADVLLCGEGLGHQERQGTPWTSQFLRGLCGRFPVRMISR